jgi:hypothetical protein
MAIDSACFRVSFFGGPSVVADGELTGLVAPRLIADDEGLDFTAPRTNAVGEELGLLTFWPCRKLGANKSGISDPCNILTARRRLADW